jgi:hypothetical protein
MNWIKNLFLVMISVILSVLFVEFFTRYAFPKISPQTSFSRGYGTSETGENYGKICDHGWCAKPGIYKNVIKINKETGEVIYSVKYTIGQNNLRSTQRVNENDDLLLRYFGGSYVFGEGLNDNETLSYYSQLASKNIKSQNLGFHGHGVHNALKLLGNTDKSKGALNLLLTGTYHALRSGCIPKYSQTHPRYELIDKKVVYKGLCTSKDDRGWINYTERTIEKINSYLQLRSLELILDYLRSSFTSYQLDLYKNLIREFYQASLERGEVPIILYMKDDRRNYFTAGFLKDPMPEYFNRNRLRFIDVTLPNEPKYYLHELDKHPSALANCERVKIILRNLNIANEVLKCN